MKFVLISLADQADENGYCWPSIEFTSDRTSLSKRSVINAIKALEDQGFLFANRMNGRRTTYTITLKNQCIPCTSAPHAPVHNLPEAVNLIPQAVHLVPKGVQEVHTNRKESSKNHKLIITKPLDVDEQIWIDWLQHRKQKKASVTQTVLDRLTKDAGLAGLSLQAVLEMCCARGWIGFDPKWLLQENRAQAKPQTFMQKRSAELAALGDRVRSEQSGNNLNVIDMGMIEHGPNL